MKAGQKSVLLCDCDGTMSIDGKAIARALGADAPDIHTQLCRRQIGMFKNQLDQREPLLVCCTQEAPVFAETMIEREADAANEPSLTFTNIRERAGWSREGASAAPKMAALIAEAALDILAAGSITLISEGRIVVLGGDADALDIAVRLSDTLDVTLVLPEGVELAPPAVTGFLVYQGTPAAARGSFGNFEIEFGDLAPAQPSARGMIEFEPGSAAVLPADLILDLRGGDALFPSPDKRDGYEHPDPGYAAGVERIVGDLQQMAGEFEKPLYVSFDDSRCTHSRNNVTGCTRCLDLCPAGAIQPAGDVVAFDPHLCAGCGNCAGVCPTDAANYALPGTKALFERLRTILTTYHDAGGKHAVLLVHDTDTGDEMISAAARHFRGLPAGVLPFAVNQVAQIGFEFLMSALAYGAEKVLLLTSPDKPDDYVGLPAQLSFAEAALDGLGYGLGRIELFDNPDPEALEAMLYDLAPVSGCPPGSAAAMERKRANLNLAAAHLHEHAPEPVDVVAMPEGAPVGTMAVDAPGCTLCLACVSVCPVGALGDNPDSPMLRFNEAACVQCGLCRVTCPEAVITLVPRLNLRPEARDWIIVKEEEPFNCVSCGKPFAVQSTIDKMMEKLADNPMFAKDPAALERLKMCEDCRVVDMFETPQPMASGKRPRIRTTDDYLRERDDGEDLDS